MASTSWWGFQKILARRFAENEAKWSSARGFGLRPRARSRLQFSSRPFLATFDIQLASKIRNNKLYDHGGKTLHVRAGFFLRGSPKWPSSPNPADPPGLGRAGRGAGFDAFLGDFRLGTPPRPRRSTVIESRNNDRKVTGFVHDGRAGVRGARSRRRTRPSSTRRKTRPSGSRGLTRAAIQFMTP